MKYIALFLLTASVALAQTTTKPAARPASPSAARPATTAKKPATGLPFVHGIVKPLFTERYEEIKIGTGPLAEPNKLYHVLYAGYLATTGQEFDSSQDHRQPVMKDGKPVMGADGKPELGEAQPMIFPQGTGRLIPGFDEGFNGMHVGGKRRIFIPWQLAYGTHDIPSREGHIGIPAKSDLIFDVELVDVTEMPQPPSHPFGGGAPRPVPPPTPPPAPSGQPAQPATPPPAATAPATPPPASTAPASSAPATPPTSK